MKTRRTIALVGFSISLVLMFGWLYMALVPRFAQPNAHRFEFWAEDGAQIRVEGEELKTLTPGSYTRATENKPLYDTVIVGGLFLVAVSSSALLLASTRAAKPAALQPSAAAPEKTP